MIRKGPHTATNTPEFWSFGVAFKPPTGPTLERTAHWQERLQRGRFWRLGNLLSDVRYWIWRLAGGRW